METINLLDKLVKINSVYPNEKRLAEFVSSYLSRLGFGIEFVKSGPSRSNIVATFGVVKKYLGFYGHLDTVPPDSLYKNNPFGIRKMGDKIFGLGTADMKAGITAILKLGEYASSRKLPVKFIFAVDEENISQGAHDLVDSGKINDVKFLISAESGQIKNTKQKYSVCYGRRGRVGLRIVVRGKSAHAAESAKGINAIESAAKIIVNIPKLSFPKNVNLGRTNLVFHKINASTESLSVPNYCEITLSALTAPLTKSEDIVKSLLGLFKKLEVDALVELIERNTPYSESFEVDKANNFLKEVERKIFKIDKVNPIYTESVADDNVFANRLQIPVISMGPIGGGDHTATEWVSLKSIDSLIRAYRDLLMLN